MTAALSTVPLDRLAEHLGVPVQIAATVVAVRVHNARTDYPWATLTVSDGTTTLDVRAYSRAWAASSTAVHLDDGDFRPPAKGDRIHASIEAAEDPQGVFAALHTLHSTEAAS